MSNQIEIFKPNSKNTGALFSFKVSPDKKSGKPIMWVTAIRQSGWNSSNSTGSFSGNAKDPANSINLKFNEFEAAGIADALRTGCSASSPTEKAPTEADSRTLSYFHKNQNGVTTVINLVYGQRKSKDKVVKSFYLGFSRGSSDKFGISIKRENEAIRLANYIDNVIRAIDVANYEEEVRKFGGGSSNQSAPVETNNSSEMEEIEDSPF